MNVIDDNPMAEKVDSSDIPPTMSSWFDMIMEDTKVTKENYIIKQMEQSNIRLKYMRYKYKYAALLNKEKVDLEWYISQEAEKMSKGSLLKDDKQKLQIIKGHQQYYERQQLIGRLQAIYDTISDGLKAVDDIGYAVNNIIKENEFNKFLDRSI